jgi:hypothetical protein
MSERTSYGRPSTSDDALIPTALAFAKRGIGVLPLHWPIEQNGRLVCSCLRHTRGQDCRSPAKHPFGKVVSNGLLDASIDSATIKYWFAVAAPHANLGVVTDKLLVLDIDPRHEGDASIVALERAHGPLPLTWRALTGGGGEHVIFAAPEAEIASLVAEQMDAPLLGRGIDIRARRGYIVAPGSRHISGRFYHWSVDHHPAEVALAPPPDWLIEKLTARAANNNNPPAPVPSTEWTKLVTGPVTEYRDLAVARIIGHLLRRWVDTSVAISLAHAWNVSHCVPPLTDREVTAIVNRIAGREAKRLTQENPQ